MKLFYALILKWRQNELISTVPHTLIHVKHELLPANMFKLVTLINFSLREMKTSLQNSFNSTLFTVILVDSIHFVVAPTCAQLYPVCFNGPWDVCRAWLESTCGKFNWLDTVWAHTFVCKIPWSPKNSMQTSTIRMLWKPGPFLELAQGSRIPEP